MITDTRVKVGGVPDEGGVSIMGGVLVVGGVSGSEGTCQVR